MFNENLKSLRKDRGFSQEQMAVRLNVVRQTISKWEKGLSVPDAEMLVKIAELFNVNVEDLLGRNIQLEEKDDSIEVIASELSKLNELLVVQCQKAEKTKKQIIKIIAIILAVIVLCCIYVPWSDMFYEFGRNLYRMLN